MSAHVGYCLFDGLCLLFLPPLFLGLLNKAKARMQGRIGAPLLQPYYDVIKLMQKEMVISQTTRLLFRFAPCITVITLLLAGAFLPMGPLGFGGFTGDMIFFFTLLAVGQFFTALAALDTGSPFEGLGASREVTFACFSKLTLCLVLLCLARISGSLNLTEMLSASWSDQMASKGLCCAGLFLVALVATGRLPFDDSETPTELDGVHLAMVFDHSGPKLAEIQYGMSTRLYLYCLLIARLLLPYSGNPWLLRAECLGIMLLLVLAMGLLESTVSRLRLSKTPNVIAGSALLCALGFLLTVRG